MNNRQAVVVGSVAALVVTCSALAFTGASYIVRKYSKQDVDKHIIISLSIHGAVLCLIGLCICLSAQMTSTSYRFNNLLHRNTVNQAPLPGCLTSERRFREVYVPNLIEIEMGYPERSVARVSGAPTVPTPKRDASTECSLPEIRCLDIVQVDMESCSDVVASDRDSNRDSIRSAPPSLSWG